MASAFAKSCQCRRERHCAMWAHTPFSSACQISLHAWLIEAGTNDAATETLFDGSAGG
jgi:hypothetical protein